MHHTTPHRGDQRVSQQRRNRRTILVGVAILAVLAFAMTMTTSRHDVDMPTPDAKAPRLTRSPGRHAPRTAEPEEDPSEDDAGKALRVTFVMTPEMDDAWRTSSERLTFPTPLTVARDGAAATSHGCTVTFYGKSSLKLKYTKRRSVQVRLAAPVRFQAGGAAITNLVLLSLWEDQHRIAYRSSAILLQKLGLFFAESHLVEMRCAMPKAGKGGKKSICGAAGTTLGAYLLVEYPSDAIARHVGEVRRSGGTLAARCRSGLQPADAMTAAALGTGPVSVATRNWMYFRKPAHYKLLHVPSFKENSTIDGAYRAVEREPLQAAPSPAGELRFAVDQYMLWVAANTLLQNGDYDDEVLFYQAGSVLGVMAWDYDSIFSPCHRGGKQALKSDLLYCAETPLEKKILSVPALRAGFARLARCAMQRELSPAAWDGAMAVARAELEAVYGGKESIRRATFQERPASAALPSVADGVAEMSKAFARNVRKMKQLLPAVAETEAVDTEAAETARPRRAARKTSAPTEAVASDASVADEAVETTAVPQTTAVPEETTAAPVPSEAEEETKAPQK
jgi:hypothetical protein